MPTKKRSKKVPAQNNGGQNRNPSLKIYEDHNCETNGCYISVEGIFTHKPEGDDDTPPEDISRNGD